MIHPKQALLFLTAWMALCPGCTLLRSVWFFQPDTSDYRHFPQRKIESPAQVFHFHCAAGTENLGQTLRLSDRFLERLVCLDDFVQRYRTEAFLILRCDTILYEKYPAGRTPADPVTSFSMSKAIVSTLAGVAVQEGLVQDLRQPLGDFLPEYPALAGVRLLDLMQHVSGVRFNRKIGSLRDDQARFYYGNNLRKALKNRGLVATPGQRFDYHSANTELLALALERATGRSVSQYLQEKIWQPLGMEAPASWSLDGRGDGAVERAFCCLQARALDFAKIGRLWLRNGEWEGRQVFPHDWLPGIFDARHPQAGAYRCGFTVQANGSFFASGLFGQMLYVHPEKNLLILRFGEHRRGYSINFWRDVISQVAEQL
jgi:CubicO group peptidase (beta-lactamase class C family)